MADQAYNPIRSVDGVTLHAPSKYDWKLSDISHSDAGRTENGKMHKMRIAQKVHLELEWQNRDGADIGAVLTAFDPEYISVVYWDYKAHSYLTKTFYVGDRSVSSYSRILDIASVSFNIIEQ